MLRRTVLSLAAAVVLPLSAQAQAGYPNKPIRAIVPFAAGSTTDIIARAITDRMSQSMGQQLVVENRAGASGTIGQAVVAQSAPDGYTLLIHSSSHTVSALGADAWTLKPEQFDAYVRDEIKSNAALVKAAGLEVHK